MLSYPYQIRTEKEYREAYERSVAAPEAFWADVAENFVWQKKWERVLRWNFDEPDVNWFEGGILNITESCIDRHLATNANGIALIWEPNNPNEACRKFTYRQLHDEVCRFAHVLTNNGAMKADRICIYMPMVPELAFAVLACARIGAVHSVIFGGFSANSIADRLEDAQCSMVITADGGFRGGKEIPLKSVMDEALQRSPAVKKVIVVKRTSAPVELQEGRDVWLHDEIKKATTAGQLDFPAVAMQAGDMLFILYTSGSTGKPKGVVHTCAGYLVYAAYTFVNVFQYTPGDVHFCTADIGWITGHSYIIYGPLAAGGTSLMFEGIPTWPDAGRFWEIVEKHRVNILYTAPTAIRSLMTFGSEPLTGKNLSSLKVLGTVGEPINDEAWHWYDREIGKGKCPIADTWWQTETGGILISNIAGITQSRPGFATLPLPGVQPVLVSGNGSPVNEDNVAGNLCIRFPWPGMLRTTYGDHERCRLNYFAPYPGLYFTGDGAFRDDAGNYRITGRIDDVLNVSGHRIGTAEVENAINRNAHVIESAVAGYPHEIKGQGIYAFVILQEKPADEDALRAAINATVSREIGSIARPDKIQFVAGLPKTRSGKIMRRILRKIAEGQTGDLGDTTTLLDPGIVQEISAARL